MAGPLSGLTIVELAGIGPGPMCSMMLGDMGADVIRVDRTKSHVMDRLADPKFAVHNRSRRSVSVDLQKKEGVEVVLRLIEKADGMTEPFRPGVAERLGVGPDVCLARNPKLVYGRMTGWGQDGPLAQTAGHDLGYVAITGALFGMGQDAGRPMFPSNLVGDFGGGSTYLVIGILAALLESRLSGEGQVVDAAIVDGTAHLNAMATGFLASGRYREQRAANLLDGGVPFYDVYETADGRHLAVGSLEPQFYDELLRGLGIADTAPDRNDPAQHGELRRVLADTIQQKTQAAWVEVFDGSDACVAPVLPMSEAFEHPHLVARGTFVERDAITQPAPAPRFSRTAPTLTTPPPAQAGQDTRDALTAWGIDDVGALLASGAATDHSTGA